MVSDGSSGAQAAPRSLVAGTLAVLVPSLRHAAVLVALRFERIARAQDRGARRRRAARQRRHQRLRRGAQRAHGTRAERVRTALRRIQRGRGAAEAAAEPLGGDAQALCHACERTQAMSCATQEMTQQLAGLSRS